MNRQTVFSLLGWLVAVTSMAGAQPCADWPDEPVQPLNVIASEYDPARCGPVGLEQYSVHEPATGSVLHFVFYDQRDPQAPVVLLHQEVPYQEGGVQYGRDILCQADDVAVIRCWEQGKKDTSWIEVLTLDGTLLDVPGIGNVCWALFDDAVLWVNRVTGEEVARLTSYDMSGPAPVVLQSMEWYSCGPAGLVQDWIVVGSWPEYAVVDVSDPAEPALIGYYGHEELPFTRPPVALPQHELCFAATCGRILKIFEITPDSQEPMREIGRVSLPSAIDTIVPQGNLLAVACEGDGASWCLVSVENPHAPSIVSPEFEAMANGFVWSPPYLYVGGAQTIGLYAVDDPTDPIWLADASVPQSEVEICRRGQVILNHGWVMPMDCDDPLGTEESSDGGDEPPAASTGIRLTVSPNPFNPATRIRFELIHTEQVSVAIHDIRGRQVRELLDRPLDAGRHVIEWNGIDDRGMALPSGSYLVRLTSDSAIRTARLVLIK